MDSNTALVLVLTIPITAAAFASAISAKYNAQKQKSRGRGSYIHPIAQIYRQINGLDLKDDSELDMEALKNEVKDLKKQLENLRDTATQFDLSIDHHLRDLDVRVEVIERSGYRYTVPSKPADNKAVDLKIGD